METNAAHLVSINQPKQKRLFGWQIVVQATGWWGSFTKQEKSGAYLVERIYQLAVAVGLGKAGVGNACTQSSLKLINSFEYISRLFDFPGLLDQTSAFGPIDLLNLLLSRLWVYYVEFSIEVNSLYALSIGPLLCPFVFVRKPYSLIRKPSNPQPCLVPREVCGCPFSLSRQRDVSSKWVSTQFFLQNLSL